MTGETFNYILAAVWLGSVLLCLIWLRRSPAIGAERALWAAVILLVPFLGALAYLLVGRTRKGGAAEPPA